MKQIVQKNNWSFFDVSRNLWADIIAANVLYEVKVLKNVSEFNQSRKRSIPYKQQQALSRDLSQTQTLQTLLPASDAPVIAPHSCEEVVMTDPEGSFTSPGYPESYPALMPGCTWTIRVEEGKQIQLSLDAEVGKYHFPYW